MNYSAQYHFLASLFDPKARYIDLNGKTCIRFVDFLSIPGKKNPPLTLLRKIIKGGNDDAEIEENKRFAYPVFTPCGQKQSNKVIILLHGLNERKWDKYLTWGQQLCESTGKAVILFPISFHLNRSNPGWLNLREMNKRLEERSVFTGNRNDNMSTCINNALSERLVEAPERFFLSGFQTANDLVALMRQIRHNRHPFFTPNSTIDTFAYSIGGFLAQVLYIANPNGLFTNSKLFLFCAGSLFKEMNGVSKFIMDKPAFDKIYRYYTVELEARIKAPGPFGGFFETNPVGMAFRSMLARERFANIRDSVINPSNKDLYAIALKDDKVIPAAAIEAALKGDNENSPGNLEILDFNFPYSHEVPFPVKGKEYTEEVDRAFNMVFEKAAGFLGDRII